MFLSERTRDPMDERRPPPGAPANPLEALRADGGAGEGDQARVQDWRPDDAAGAAVRRGNVAISRRPPTSGA